MPNRKRQKPRKGIECVEVAITLPLLVLAMFSTVSITHQWHVEKLLKIASYEAIKAGCAKEGTAADAIRVFNQHTEALGINNARLIIDQNSFDTADVGQMLSLRSEAPLTDNQIVSPIGINLSSQLSGGTIFYRKEGL